MAGAKHHRKRGEHAWWITACRSTCLLPRFSAKPVDISRSSRLKLPIALLWTRRGWRIEAERPHHAVNNHLPDDLIG